MILIFRYNFLSFVILVLMSNIVSFKAHAAGQNSCSKYLNSSDQNGDGLFDSALQSLIKVQEDMYAIKIELMEQVHLYMKERSLPVKQLDVYSEELPDKRQALYPVPVFSPKTIEMMKVWWKKSPLDATYFELEADILHDPYLTWLKNNWTEMRPRELLAMDTDFSMIPRLDGKEGPLPKGVPANITEYMDFHLRYAGPMNLSPELLMLRLAFDHDPKIKKADRDLIYKVLALHKAMYILNSEIRRLANFEFGDQESWDQFGTYKNVLAEFAALKSKIKYMLSDYSLSSFLLFQFEGKLPEAMSFEDYLVIEVLAKSGDPADFHIYEKYMFLKNIIKYVSIAQDEEVLQEHLEERLQSLFPYFLF